MNTGTCQFCGKQIPSHMYSTARFCCEAHRKAAWERIHRLKIDEHEANKPLLHAEHAQEGVGIGQAGVECQLCHSQPIKDAGSTLCPACSLEIDGHLNAKPIKPGGLKAPGELQ
ncbi:MAG: hypothetical protein V1734_00080 [Nanoarchaeota archaeon]